MQLYDTARRAIVGFGQNGSEVTVYVCGITPYDSAHLGHAFTYHVFDVLTRRLRAAGAAVRMVRNVTDVDDDILRVARERRIDAAALTDAEVGLFDRQMADLGMLPVDSAPRASQHVPAMIEWVRTLERRGFAYAVDGWAYFDTSRYHSYGQLSRLGADEMIALSRERGANPDDPRKRHPLDFVLWQPSTPGEPRWASPWSDGRPGWHIECTVLATDSLGAPIDIHGGGDDLIFPHHESEIAQAEAAGISPYVRHWMHVAMVQLDGVKMSKSLGNLIFVGDLLRRAPSSAVRLMLAAHHYRESWQYDERELHAAVRRKDAYAAAIAGGANLAPVAADDYERRYWDRLDDDLDTPGALGVLDALAGALLEPGGSLSAGVAGGELLDRLLDVLGSRTASLAV